MDLDQIGVYVVSAVLFIYALHVSTVFEIQYPQILVELYGHPWWRVLLVVLIILAWNWAPVLGTLLAIVVFFYFHDLYLLTSKELSSSTR